MQPRSREYPQPAQPGGSGVVLSHRREGEHGDRVPPDRGDRPGPRRQRLHLAASGSRDCTALCEIRDRRLGRRLLPVVVLLALTSGSPAARGDGLEVSPASSSDGVYQLKWPASGRVVIEESETDSFSEPRVVYRGTDHATTLTGRADGTYFYRLRSDPMSGGDVPVAAVTVAHHPLERALAFFAVGLGVFVATVVLVVRGARADNPDAVGSTGGPRG